MRMRLPRGAITGAILLATCVAASADTDPKTVVAALNDGLVKIEKAGEATPFPQRYQTLAPLIDQAFNLPAILKTVVGLRWDQLPADQQTRLVTVFRAYTISNYVANFNSDSGDQFRILPDIRTVGDERIVATEIVPKTGDPTRIDYVMRQQAAGQGDAAWQAVDVLQQGTISQAAVQRSDFRSLLQGGNGATTLIASLEGKVNSLSGGTLKP